MGPIEAKAIVAGRVRFAASRRAMRLRAVEALEKVMASGKVAGLLKSFCSAGMESAGI